MYNHTNLHFGLSNTLEEDEIIDKINPYAAAG